MKNINTHFNKQYFESRKHIAWRGDVVAQAIIDSFKPESVVDVGCSIGDIVAGLQKAGVQTVRGIDGAFEAGRQYVGPPKSFVYRDMRKAKGISMGVFKLCICFEVFQYIEQKYHQTFIRNLQRLSNKILISVPEELEPAVELHMVSNKFRKKDILAFRAPLEHLKSKPAIKGIYHNTMYFERA